MLYFPSGSFLITSTINLVSSVAYEVQINKYFFSLFILILVVSILKILLFHLKVAGDGFSSTVLWAFDGHLFSISPPPNNQAADIIFHNLQYVILFILFK